MGEEFPEQEFQAWYRERAEMAGIDPDPDNPRHMYDYRAAFLAGVEPEISPEDGRYHWPSEYKSDEHPNRFVNGWDTKYNIPAGQSSPLEIKSKYLIPNQNGGYDLAPEIYERINKKLRMLNE